MFFFDKFLWLVDDKCPCPLYISGCSHNFLEMSAHQSTPLLQHLHSTNLPLLQNLLPEEMFSNLKKRRKKRKPARPCRPIFALRIFAKSLEGAFQHFSPLGFFRKEKWSTSLLQDTCAQMRSDFCHCETFYSSKIFKQKLSKSNFGKKNIVENNPGKPKPKT